MYQYCNINTRNQLLFYLILISWACWAPGLPFCPCIFSIIRKKMDRNVLVILVYTFLVRRLPFCDSVVRAAAASVFGQFWISIAQGVCGQVDTCFKVTNSRIQCSCLTVKEFKFHRLKTLKALFQWYENFVIHLWKWVWMQTFKDASKWKMGLFFVEN